MRKIFGIGETVLDIIFKKGAPQAAKAGGSVLNSVVSMGRIGLPASFISEYGLDEVGKLIDNFLRENGVDTSFVHRFGNGSTAIALAFLNDKNDASYSFYKDYPENRLDIVFPEIAEDDIVQCGSFYAIWPEIREKFRSFLSRSRESGALILYDPNFRKSHLSDLEKLKPLMIENMKMAEIIRGSDEDFYNIFGAKTPDEAWYEVKKYCSTLVYTANVNGVFVKTPGFAGQFLVKKIKPVSTIGAGDNFNAGMITAIYSKNISGDDIMKLKGEDWADIISYAVDFATEVCMSYENYISMEFAGKYRKSEF